ncbi:MAG TPA: carbohydrate ABC transporter permease, partial [Chloroflexi bacterium]|nr:carbohydrate ABC transporter permease [Chloroflexota bacterium]
MANSTQTLQTTPAVSGEASGPRFNLSLGKALIYLILIAGGILAILPFFWMVSTSLMTLGETINKQWLPKVPQFSNYVEAWTEAKFGKYFLNSVIITTVTLAGLLTTSILAGYAFGRMKFFG